MAGLVVRLLLLAAFLAAFSYSGWGSAASPAAAAGGNRLYLPVVFKGYTPGEKTGPFGYGLNLALDSSPDLAQSAGFDWVKLQLAWKVSETSPGNYDWADSDSYAKNLVTAAERSGRKLLLRVDTPPAWANGGAGDQAPPSNPDDYGRFVGALARAFQGRIQAYEIWNEPNIGREWGNRSPNPGEYAALLKSAYTNIKAADPSALVVTAGLATTGGDGGATALDDLAFIRGLYNAGAKGYFDALGSHPYGFSSAPEDLWGANVLFFRRAEAQRQVMLDYGDAGKQVWATEFGWLLDPAAYGQSCDWPDRNWQKVSPQTQADYLPRAYQYAFANWSWMGPMFVFNLDFSAAPWYESCDPMRWYSVVNADKSPRPAYTALKDMPKPLR